MPHISPFSSSCNFSPFLLLPLIVLSPRQCSGQTSPSAFSSSYIYCSSCTAAGGVWYFGENKAAAGYPQYEHDTQNAGGQCFSSSESDHRLLSLYQFKSSYCRTSTNPGFTFPNPYVDYTAAVTCKPSSGNPTCSGCTSVTGCVFSSDISDNPGRGAVGTCEPSARASLQFVYTTPSSCTGTGEYNRAATPTWLAIIPLLLVIAYVVNAAAVCIAAKRRGQNPCAWFFIAIMFNIWSWVCLFGCTSKQPARSVVVPITSSSNSTAFVPPLQPYGQVYSGPGYGQWPPSAYGQGTFYPQPDAHNYQPGVYSTLPGAIGQNVPAGDGRAQHLVPHSTAYVASPALSDLPPNPYGTPVYSAKTP